MSNQKSIERMQSVDKLIADKMMLVDTEHFHVSMLAELWNLYYDEGKKHLCRNILNYCRIKRAYDQMPVAQSPVLLISIKDAQGESAPYAYFRNGEIDIIKNTEVIRNFEKRNLKRFMFMFLRIGLLIALITSLLIWLL